MQNSPTSPNATVRLAKRLAEQGLSRSTAEQYIEGGFGQRRWQNRRAAGARVCRSSACC